MDIRQGVEPTALLQLDDSIEVSFSDGTQGRYDLVVGADGINSKVRSLAFGPASLRYTGQMSFRGIVDDMPSLDNLIEIWGDDKRIGLTAIGGGSVYFYATIAGPDSLADCTPDETFALFKEAFVDIGPQFEPIFNKIEHADQLIFTALSELLDHPWHTGRVVLIGDAAHAMTPNLGQGGAMAIEDAVMLGRLLAAGGEVPQILADFVAARLEQVRSVQDRSRAFGSLAHLAGQPGADRLLRDHGASFMDALVNPATP